MDSLGATLRASFLSGARAVSGCNFLRNWQSCTRPLSFRSPISSPTPFPGLPQKEDLSRGISQNFLSDPCLAHACVLFCLTLGSTPAASRKSLKASGGLGRRLQARCQGVILDPSRLAGRREKAPFAAKSR